MSEILKAGVKTGVGAVLSAVCSVAVNKTISVMLGTVGMGLFGLLNQWATTAMAFASFGGGGNALVQGIASRDDAGKVRYAVTTFWLFASTAFLAAVVLHVGAPVLVGGLEGQDQGLNEVALRAFLLPILLGVLAVYSTSVLNGYRQIGALALVKVLGALTSAIVAIPALGIFKETPVYGLAIIFGAGMLVRSLGSTIVLHRQGLLRPLLRAWETLDGSAARTFFAISAAYFFAAQISQGSVLVLQSAVVKQLGLEAAGIFNAVWNVSMGHVMLILTSFSTFYLPSLAALKEPHQSKELLGGVFRFTTLLAVPLVVTLVLFRPWMLELMYSRAFRAGGTLMRWMLIGDYLKMSAWVFAMPVSARGNMRVFLATEAGWFLGFLGLSLFWMGRGWLLESMGVAYLVMYVLHLGFHVFYIYRHYRYLPSRAELGMWVLGLGLVVLSSVLAWEWQHVRWEQALPLTAASWLFSWAMLTASERRGLWATVQRRLGRSR